MPRKADVFAGDGSFAGKLRRRRDLMESGEVEAAQEVMASADGGEADGGEASGGSHDLPDNRYKRGFRSNQ